ncbi:MAG: 4-(cytidine 5'-diphospho)-2-C-methyl-D-erythritol kinase [Clostridia bacterium]|nr:4-(cytidine 5'-diphospho)-2-C-methyl-D-erythritol kinase [Clostridia bacterium]
MIFEKAYAKLNLFLDIEGKRPNGYHNILSVMQTVDWFDEIYIRKNVSDDIVLGANSKDIPCGVNNTAYRAAVKYLEAISEKCGVEIEIRKSIPVAAGMAGGSADAAAVLRGMNRLFDGRLSMDKLLELGASIGADVPFCILGGTKTVRGIGEEISPCEASFPKSPILCAKLGEGISTPEAYRLLDERHGDFAAPKIHQSALVSLLDGMKQKRAELAALGFFNIFEEVIGALRPAVSEVKKIMCESGAIAAMMSGSGPSVFGVFKNEKEAEMARLRLVELGAMTKICYPV